MFKLKHQLKALSLSLVVVMSVPLVLPPTQSYAATTKYPIISQNYKINGLNTSIGSIQKSGSTYIALRSLNTALGLSTQYNSTTRIVEVKGRGRTMMIDLNNHGGIQLNGQNINGPQAIVQDGTTYLPLRFVLENFGYDVSYDSQSKLIGLNPISENNLTIQAEQIGADGDGKSLNVYYPVLSGFSSTQVQEKINNVLKQEADKFIAEGLELMNPIVKENEKILDENPDAVIRRPSFDGRYTVTYNEKGLLSLYVDYDVYLGGAHNSIIRSAYTFDLATGDRLSLKDIAGEKTNAVTIINQEIKKQIKERELLLNVPFETIKEDREFFLNRTGVVIYFNQNEYTAYADGMPQFTIPFTQFSKQ